MGVDRYGGWTIRQDFETYPLFTDELVVFSKHLILGMTQASTRHSNGGRGPSDSLSLFMSIPLISLASESSSRTISETSVSIFNSTSVSNSPAASLTNGEGGRGTWRVQMIGHARRSSGTYKT